MDDLGKNILLITYYWPPSGGPGVQRWLKTVKHLSDMGLHIHVYTPENPEMPAIDLSLEKEVPKEVTVVKKKIIEPYNIYNFLKGNKTKSDHSSFLNKKDTSIFQKLALWVRGNLLIPDARIFWVKPSVRFLNSYITKNKIATIITTGPPHSMHLIGLGLKNKNKDINWIADFRDPWTFIDFIDKLDLSNYAEKKHTELEKQVILNANHCVTVSPSWKMIYEKKYGKHFDLIYNGFDSNDFKNHIDNQLTEKITLAHIGTMNQDRNPTAFWKILGDILKKDTALKNNFELVLKGKVYPETFIELEENDIPYSHELYVSHDKAIETLCSSHLLLLPVNNTISDNELGHIPGKFYEYLASGRPIICFGNENSDIKKIMDENNEGLFLAYDNINEEEILSLIQNKTLINKRSKQTIPFERKTSAEEFYKIINS